MDLSQKEELFTQILLHNSCLERGFSEESCPPLCKRATARVRREEKDAVAYFDNTAGTFPHLTEDEFVDLHFKTLSPEKEEQLSLHLQECGYCQGMWIDPQDLLDIAKRL